jgi:hypothetical protein
MSAGAPPPEDEQRGGNGRDLDLSGIARRLKALNPNYTDILVQPPRKPDSGVRVTIVTTRKELQAAGGRLRLVDPELQGLRIETALRFLDRKPGETINVRIRKNEEPPKPTRTRKPTRFDA